MREGGEDRRGDRPSRALICILATIGGRLGGGPAPRPDRGQLCCCREAAPSALGPCARMRSVVGHPARLGPWHTGGQTKHCLRCTLISGTHCACVGSREMLAWRCGCRLCSSRARRPTVRAAALPKRRAPPPHPAGWRLADTSRSLPSPAAGITIGRGRPAAVAAIKLCPAPSSRGFGLLSGRPEQRPLVPRPSALLGRPPAALLSHAQSPGPLVSLPGPLTSCASRLASRGSRARRGAPLARSPPLTASPAQPSTAPPSSCGLEVQVGTRGCRLAPQAEGLSPGDGGVAAAAAAAARACRQWLLPCRLRLRSDTFPYLPASRYRHTAAVIQQAQPTPAVT